MKLVSFDPLRTLDIPGVQTLKPEDWLRRKTLIEAADWLLFPEYWQVNALVYAWRKRIFPSPASYHLGHDKIEMTRAFQALVPQHVPQTAILPTTPTSIEEILDTFALPLIVKDVRSSMGLGVQLIEDSAALRAIARDRDVLYAQEYLPIRRDLRIVWIGDRVACAYWRSAAEGQLHNNVARGAAISFEDIPSTALDLVRTVATGLGVDHAGFDVAVLDNHPFLFEFNVRFGTQALNERGVAAGHLILKYLQNLAQDNHCS